MERLTRRTKLGAAEPYIRLSSKSENEEWLRDVVNKLAEYEDLGEQGLLLRLPCKVGDTVYVINSFHIDGSLRKNSKLVETKFNVFMFDYIGKTVFLTREEAEAKLKEINDKKECL